MMVFVVLLSPSKQITFSYMLLPLPPTSFDHHEIGLAHDYVFLILAVEIVMLKELRIRQS
jgi:hypothetical protein